MRLQQFIVAGATQFDVTVDFGINPVPVDWAPLIFAWSFTTTVACDIELSIVEIAGSAAHLHVIWFKQTGIENAGQNGGSSACKRVYRTQALGEPWKLRFTSTGKTADGMFTVLWAWGPWR